MPAPDSVLFFFSALVPQSSLTLKCSGLPACPWSASAISPSSKSLLSASLKMIGSCLLPRCGPQIQTMSPEKMLTATSHLSALPLNLWDIHFLSNGEGSWTLKSVPSTETLLTARAGRVRFLLFQSICHQQRIVVSVGLTMASVCRHIERQLTTFSDIGDKPSMTIHTHFLRVGSLTPTAVHITSSGKHRTA